MKLTTPRCRKCHNPITPQSEDDVLDKFGEFYSLRCPATDCGHIDWYRDVAFAPVSKPAAEPAGPAIQELGEVWIHDVFLGLSFKADGQLSHDIE